MYSTVNLCTKRGTRVPHVFYSKLVYIRCVLQCRCVVCWCIRKCKCAWLWIYTSTTL